MNKNAVISVILVVVIVVGVLFVGRALGFFGGAKAKLPPAVSGLQEERMDSVTLEVVTRTIGEWKKLGEKDGAYMNPTTKTYTMVLPMECGACGAKIPKPQFPANLRETPKDAADFSRIETEKARLRAAYICPKCEKPAFSGYDPYGSRRPGARVRREESTQ